MNQLPETGFLRLSQIIGEGEITEAQAAANLERNRFAEAEALKKGRVDKKGRPIFTRLPVTPRPATPAIIPVKKSCWWDGVRSGRFPKPVKLGPRVTAWRVGDIRALIASA